jgi:hypothetical protein
MIRCVKPKKLETWSKFCPTTVFHESYVQSSKNRTPYSWVRNPTASIRPCSDTTAVSLTATIIPFQFLFVHTGFRMGCGEGCYGLIFKTKTRKNAECIQTPPPHTHTHIHNIYIGYVYIYICVCVCVYLHIIQKFPLLKYLSPKLKGRS